MAEVKSVNLKKATVTLIDGTPTTPKTLEFKMGEGNLTFSIKRNLEYLRNRGRLAGGEIREGDEEPCEVSLQGRFNHVRSSSGDPVTVTEFLTKTGNASAHTTTGSACEPDAVNIQVDLDYDCAGIEDERLLFTEFRYEEIGGDFQSGQLDVSGKSNEVMPTSIRTTFA